MILRLAARCLTLLLYLLTILSAYGGYVPPQIWAMPSMLVLAFPYLLILTVIVALGWLIGGRFFTAIVGGITVFLCWPVGSDACPVAFGSEVTNPSVSVMTYNVYDLTDYRNPASKGESRTLSYIINRYPDIACLQEISRLPRKREVLRMQSDTLRRMYPYIIEGKPCQGAYSPFMFLSRYPAVECRLPEWIWTDCALYKVRLPRLTMHVLNVHLTSYRLTNSERKVISNMRNPGNARESMSMERPIYNKLSEAFRQRQHLATLIRGIIDTIQGPLIVCGDFNDVPGSYAYRKVRGDNLQDAVAKTTLGPMITYNAHGFLFHIDQILYTPQWFVPCATERGSVRSSDHYPVMTTFTYHSR